MSQGSARMIQQLERWRHTASSAAAVALLEAAEADRRSACKNDRTAWCDFLDLTRHPDFLTALPDSEARTRWAELTFGICEAIDFTLEDLLSQRTQADPHRTLFRELSDSGGQQWSYEQIRRRVRSTAALLLHEGVCEPGSSRIPEPAGDELRVALLSTNSIGAACCDLACLLHDIFVTPLNVHFNAEELAWIFDRLRITTAICDHPDRLEKLLAVRERVERPFRIYTLHDTERTGAHDIELLEHRRSQLDTSQVDRLIAERPRRGQHDTLTAMFTSGSTGRPKGVVFTQHNLVTKRFARAAALPEVGRDETMLCYLPLFHTFGRYLEMLGTIFWGGTYVFSGNPSAETLIRQMQEVGPTALISVPIRWIQIRETVLKLQAERGLPPEDTSVFRELVGPDFSWGLSAAGYLDPKVFRWYHAHGVRLNSGFGMTEGTGGLTMTPPNDYQSDSVGIPLPGVAVRLGELDELQVAGPYIAHYLSEGGEANEIDVPEEVREDYWLPTGDLFHQAANGHLSIVDRIKDIYKNDRGQTVAPRKVESLFEDVPGIRRTFLVGDGRAYNTLLIVPDDDDPVLQSLSGEEERHEYFQRLVTAANPNLAAFERVVDFTVLDRDFELAKGELTAKGSYRRKAIEASFEKVISDLYHSNVRRFEVEGLSISIPLWFFRNLGILESAIEVTPQGLVQTEDSRRLRIARQEDGHVRIGDLVYRLEGNEIDLGLMARQPLLWLGNPALIAFSPCRIGWDVPLGPFAEQVFRPNGPETEKLGTSSGAQVDQQLKEIHVLACRALYGELDDSLEAIRGLSDQLDHVGAYLAAIIRRRLEALATHPRESVRCRAYQVLVLDQPMPDYLTYLPSFIESGLPFLDEKSFLAISRARIEPRRLAAFRKRLYSYRTQLQWPAPERTRRLFHDLFRLLADFVRYHPDFYGTVREELVLWILHDQDPALADAAREVFLDLAAWYEERLEAECLGLDPSEWTDRIAFQDGLSERELKRVREVLIGTSFLRESVLLAFEGEEFCLQDVGRGGIWVSSISSRFEDTRYRVSVNTLSGKHFDLQLIVRMDGRFDLMGKTIDWTIALRGHPFGTPMLPRFGCCRPALGAFSMAYVSGLTVWEQIRKFSSVRGPGTRLPSRFEWQQLMTRAMSIVVKGWRNSGGRIIPGLVSANNIVIPEPDFRRGAMQNSLSGWRPYDGPISLLRPLWQNIFGHTVQNYPWTREFLEAAWIFESYVEALGVDEALPVLRELQARMRAENISDLGDELPAALDRFLIRLESKYFQPLALRAAVVRCREWEKINVNAPLQARLENLEELVRLYRLDRMPDLARFHLYRQTYFQNSDPQLLDVFDRLLVRMHRLPEQIPTHLVELSDLQSLLAGSEDRTAFSRLVFPHRARGQQAEVKTVGDPARGQVIVRTAISDRFGRTYQMGEPSGPADVGQLYRLFLQAGFPKAISEADRYFVASDETEQIVGGVVYRLETEGIVVLDGIVVTEILAERGISSAIMDDFCSRMKAQGNRAIRTHYYLRRFYQQHGFRLDRRLGGLVRYL